MEEGTEKFLMNKPFTPPSNHRKHSSKCFFYFLFTFVLLSIALLVFSIVVLHIKTPTLRLSNVIVKDLRYEWASLNMTMIAEIRLHNMNLGRFKFGGGRATLLYENATIGATNIHNARVRSREKLKINATVKVIAGPSRELSQNYMNLSRDIGLGLVKLRSLAELRGEVRVVKIMNRRRTAVMDCTMDLNLKSRIIQGLSCQ